MEKNEVFRLLNGFYGYDTCGPDFGISDPAKEEELYDYLMSLDRDTLDRLLAEYCNLYYLSDEAIKLGYGMSDMRSFLRWFEDDFSFDLG